MSLKIHSIVFANSDYCLLYHLRKDLTAYRSATANLLFEIDDKINKLLYAFIYLITYMFYKGASLGLLSLTFLFFRLLDSSLVRTRVRFIGSRSSSEDNGSCKSDSTLLLVAHCPSLKEVALSVPCLVVACSENHKSDHLIRFCFPRTLLQVEK